MPAWQRHPLLLNQRQGLGSPGAGRGHTGGCICYMRGSWGRGSGAGSPGVGTHWGQEDGRKGTVSPGGEWLGVSGVLSLEGPAFAPRLGWEGALGVQVTDSPPWAQGVLLVLQHVTSSPTCHPSPWVQLSHAAGSSLPPPRGARAASPSPRCALPRVTSAPLPWWAPPRVPTCSPPSRDRRWGGFVLPGARAPVAACACLPAPLSPGGKKSNENSLV